MSYAYGSVVDRMWLFVDNLTVLQTQVRPCGFWLACVCSAESCTVRYTVCTRYAHGTAVVVVSSKLNLYDTVSRLGDW